VRIDADKAREIYKEVELALTEIADRHGMVLRPAGSFSFQPFSMPVPFRLTAIKSDGDMSKDELSFKKHASKYGLSDHDYGRSFSRFGRCYRAVSINPKNWANSLIAERVSDGRRVKMPPIEAIRCWKEQGNEDV